MGKLFETDGVRGLSNVELTPELALNLGRAGAYVLTKHNDKKPKIIVGRDTRVSGHMLEAALVAGMTSVGAEAVCVGVIPTPAIAYLVRAGGYDAGIMITASHNPFYDNGIKFIDQRGFKLSDDIEIEIEGYIFNGMSGIPRGSGDQVGRRREDGAARRAYIDHLKSVVAPDNLTGLRVALDCANGAAFSVATSVFRELGASVVVIGDDPDGANINRDCGSTHIGALSRFTVKSAADVGFAFDGDADRLITIDERGGVVDGDMYLSIVGNHMKDEGLLRHNTIVTTIMANMGFMEMAKERGITLETTKVGDRYVLAKMLRRGHNLGGEQSGHIIFLDHATTGDGILSALMLCKVLKARRAPLTTINAYMTVYPQVLMNASVPNEKKYLYVDNEAITAAITDCENAFAGRGRVLIRPSGTEPLVRVMLEGKEIDEIRAWAERLKALIEDELA
ncbi:MAG: phosphoglucosamine mutase [Clostridiales bacterium]|jgi:phosphoglucosamine mutase|nr:phosphoglucosamine mutase [Clostridiales bacterium]